MAYVDEAINEKFVTSIDIKKDPAAATAKSEKRPNPYKLPQFIPFAYATFLEYS